jgi:hypothetical protein
VKRWRLGHRKRKYDVRNVTLLKRGSTLDGRKYDVSTTKSGFDKRKEVSHLAFCDTASTDVGTAMHVMMSRE